MTEAPALPAMTLGDMQHWVSVVGRMQQMLMEFSLRQMGKVPELLTKGPEAGGTMNMHLPDLSQANILAKWFEAADPAKLIEMQKGFWTEATSLWSAFLTPGQQPPEQAPVKDRRFADKSWESNPVFDVIRRSYLLLCEHLLGGVQHLDGLPEKDRQRLRFATETVLDAISPSNFPLTNPRVIERTLETRGDNLLHGLEHMLHDLDRGQLTHSPETAFEVGRNIAATPGKVVHENAFYQLIQYTPTTPKVHAEPILFVPAWIMKYYVLDLEPRNSMVKFLVDAGYTVFMISWKNPHAEDRELGLDDYHRLGVRAALDTIAKARPDRAVHAVGYCLGGTLLAMVASLLGRERSHVLKSITLLAAQVDFTDPGELSLFIDESQVAFFDNQMAVQGVLDKGQMRGTFQMLRSRDLVWSYRLATYLMGERAPISALMAWNADGTHLPYRMHSEYLHALYLDNALAHGEYRLGGVPISLSDIHTPIFSVGAVQDHVAPWRSVFKLHQFTTADQTFVLTAGGHNVGIVNPPGSPKSSHRIRHWKHLDRLLTPDEWLAETHAVPGSWWTPWLGWLRRHSSSLEALPRQLPSLGKAPGTYVLQK